MHLRDLRSESYILPVCCTHPGQEINDVEPNSSHEHGSFDPFRWRHGDRSFVRQPSKVGMFDSDLVQLIRMEQNISLAKSGQQLCWTNV
jgi:hypothetical protein